MSDIGSLIKSYRKRKGISQLDLELAIDGASGMISRIESGKVNPTKDTLSKIITELELSPLEAAQFFNLDFNYFADLIRVTDRLHSYADINDLIHNSVDDIIKVLNLIGSSIYLVEGDELRFKAMSTNRYSKLAQKLLPFIPEKITFKLNVENKSILANSVLEKRALVTYDICDLASPPIPRFIARKIQKMSFAESFISLPLLNGDECIGVALFAKGLRDDFEAELGFLNAFTDSLSNMIVRLRKYESWQ